MLCVIRMYINRNKLYLRKKINGKNSVSISIV